MAQVPPRPTTPRAATPAHAGATPPAASGQRAKEADKTPGTFFLGRYRVVDEIGVGGMASVHLARMDGPGGFQKWVAIKRIHPHLVEDDQFVDMFLDEARIAAGINHANVAQVFDLGKDENTYWIAMEYLHGEPLREVMRRAEDRRAVVTAELASRICSDAAEGLHAAHELRGKNNQLLGLVHRDVTPHNLFITYDGYTKVVDFGIAKVADRLSSTRAGTLKGKLAYMSPEQVRGAEVDRTTDIFALGVVLWELTTSQRLFRMDTDLDTLEKVQACVVPPPSSLVADYPPELESIVMRALAKRKQDRFQTAREFSRALQNFLMRRGAFVGPEEVAQFVRQVFADRIQKREAHLAWAAEVTSTINVDQLRALGGGSADDPSLVSYESAEPPKRKGPMAGPPPSLPAPVPVAPMSAGGPMQSPQARAPYGASAPPPMTPPAPPTPPPMTPAMQQDPQLMAATSLMDDDEDVPTTVATKEHLEAPGMRPQVQQPPERFVPRPAAGMPAAGGGPPPQYQQQHPQQPAYASGAYPMGDERTAAFPSGAYPAGGRPGDDLGATVALPSGPRSPISPAMQQQFPALGNAMPQANGYGMPPNGAPQYAAQQQPQLQQPGMPFPHYAQAMAPQSQIETALSLPRPDPAALWHAQQEELARRPPRKNAVLVAVVVLTALCVAGIGALVYFKLKSPGPELTTQADTQPTTTNVAPPTAPPAETVTTPTAEPSATAAPTATATAAPPAPITTNAPPAPAPTATPQPAAAATAAPSATAKAGEEPGFLTIVCNPFCDDVIDGGRSLGPSPIVHLAVKPGQHRITLKRKDFPSKTISVMIVSGQVTAQRVSMK